MTEEVSQHRLKRPQISLWVLLFVIPTIAGVIFAGYSAFAAQDKRYRDLVTEEAMLIQECSESKTRSSNLLDAERTFDRVVTKWNSAEEVLIGVRTGNQAANWADKDPIYFFLQASDDQLDEVVDLLAKEFPDSPPKVQRCILGCLRSFPECITPERRERLREKVQKFVEPIQFDSDGDISQLAIETLHAFNAPYPLREED